MISKSGSRRCGRCHECKPSLEFAWRRKARGQRDSYCRDCRAAYKQEHYSKNRQRYVDNAAAWRRRTLDERWEYLRAYLAEHPCVDCGETDLLVLEFDHLRDKEFVISVGITHKPWPAVLREIEKCEVLCANCHRRRSAARHGYLRARLLDD